MHVISSGGIPLSLFLLVRGYRRGSAPTVFAGWLVATWQLALGFTLGLMLAYLLAALAVVLLLAWRRSRPSRQVLAASAAGAVVFAAMGLLLALPYQEVRDAHPESERTKHTVAAFSRRARDVPGGAGPEHDLGAGHRARSRRARLRAGADALPGAARRAARGRSDSSRASPFPKRIADRARRRRARARRAVARLPDARARRSLSVPPALRDRPGLGRHPHPGPAEHAHLARRSRCWPPPAHTPSSRDRRSGERRSRSRCLCSCCSRACGFPNPHPTVAKPPRGARAGHAAPAAPPDVRVRVAPLPRLVDGRLPGDRQRARQLQADRVRPSSSS